MTTLKSSDCRPSACLKFDGRPAGDTTAADSRETDDPAGPTLRDRVLPTTGRGEPLDFSRPPALRLIIVNRRVRFEIRVDYPPGLFDVILAREERRVAGHGVAQYPLISVLLLASGRATADYFRGLGNHFISR